MTEPIQVQLLGQFALMRAGKTIELPRRKTQALLAYLALYPEPHTREKLAALFWGDVSDDKARNSLRAELAALRKALGANALVTDRETVQWNSDVLVCVDAQEISDLRFLISDLNSTPLQITNQTSEIIHYRDLLPDFYDDWVLQERERLRVAYCEALLRYVQHLRAASEYPRAIEFARRVLAADRANERAHQHLMVCLVQSGDRAAALKQYDACVDALRAELDVAPSDETIALYEWLKQSHTPRSLAAQLTNLPIRLTSFVGRQRETVELKHLLRGDADTPRARLVTLTGAGGSGKTRLAIQVGTDLVDAYRDGVWWVELAPLHDATLVAQAVARALGIQEQANENIETTLVQVLRERALLLILDNCEHLIEACATLAYTLLTQCPAVQILATSRENLNVPDEAVRVVSLLSVPDVRTEPAPHAVGKLAALAMGFESVRLFVERARAAQPAFLLTDDNVAPVIEICRRLDGIPLALELAAARLKTFSPAQIAARLDARLDLLHTGARARAAPTNLARVDGLEL